MLVPNIFFSFYVRFNIIDYIVVVFLLEIHETTEKMSVDIETDLMDQGALFHRELDFVDHCEIRVRDLVVLYDEVCECDVPITNITA